MSVKLIALSKPVIEGCDTAGQLVAYCARVSNPANQGSHDTSPKLLDYLARNKHWSPFEMAHAVMEINTTRDIARQILRHRSFSFQEFSGRYAEMPDDPVFREARMQDTKNRQNSLECDREIISSAWEVIQEDTWSEAVSNYRMALDMGIAKEVARALLPEGITPSRLYMAGNLRSWLHYIEVRTDPSTQKEHRIIAQQCADVLAEAVPEIAEFMSK